MFNLFKSSVLVVKHCLCACYLFFESLNGFLSIACGVESVSLVNLALKSRLVGNKICCCIVKFFKSSLDFLNGSVFVIKNCLCVIDFLFKSLNAFFRVACLVKIVQFVNLVLELCLIGSESTHSIGYVLDCILQIFD